MSSTTTQEEDYRKELARIENVSLEIEDHGILTLLIDLHKEEGFHQGFGMYSLDQYDEKLKRRKGTAAGMDYVIQILNVFGVRKLEDIKGKMCYALYRPDDELIKGIQSLEIDGGKRFTIQEWCKLWGIPK